MSLIHEALKKAEQQRRLGEPPTLGTPFARASRQRSLLPYLALAIAAALGAGWWLSRDDKPAAAPSTTAAASAPAATGTASAGGSGARPDAVSADTAPVASTAAERRPTMGAGAVANPQVVDSLAPPPRLNNQAPAPNNPPSVKEVAERESEPHPPGANPLAPGEAAPLALGTPPADPVVNDAEGLASKMAVKAQETGAPPPVPPPAAPSSGSPFFKDRPSLPAKTAAAPRNAPSERPPPPPAPLEPLPAAAPAAAPAPPATAASVAAAPGAAPPEALPAYWQLPYNLRKELPELKLSMHVYSATPAQRFIVLNGNRQVEGDELGGEVRVSEIRSDGVVLTYQGQRFLVPRGGS